MSQKPLLTGEEIAEFNDLYGRLLGLRNERADKVARVAVIDGEEPALVERFVYLSAKFTAAALGKDPPPDPRPAPIPEAPPVTVPPTEIPVV